MEFRFFLDGTLYTNPKGYEELAIFLERAETIKGLIKKYTNQFTFTGAAYYYLFNLKKSGFCQLVDARIQYRTSATSGWKKLFYGYANITDMKFTHYPFNTVEVVIEDNGYTTLINNNKKIKTRVQGLTKSKNGVTITTVVPDNIDFFDSLTGAYDFPNITSYSVSECFRFLVAFMTDDQVDYQSPLFESGGDLENIFINTGTDINTSFTGLGNVLTISFEELFMEMDKRFNISIRMDNTGVRPKIIIDRTETIFSATVSETLQNPDKVEESYEKGFLFSVIKFGGEHIINDGSDFDVNFPELPFIGFRQEEYNILGQCNVDNTLDLTQNWISDHNIIHVTVKDNVNQYNDKTFVFEADPADLTKARQYDTYNPGTAPYYYNLGLTNQAIAINYEGSIPGSIASFLNPNLDTFSAGLTGDLQVIDGVIIWDKDTPPEGLDLGLNYDNTTGRYTAPVGKTGSYSFHTNFKFFFDIALLAGVPTGTEIARLSFKRYNAASVLLETYPLPSIYYTTPSIYGYAFTYSVFLNATDYLTMEADVDYDAVYITVAAFEGYSVFEATSTPDEGGVYMEYDTNNYRIINYDFNYPLNISRMLNIINNETRRINFTLDYILFGGHVQKIEFQIRKSMAVCTLLTKQTEA